MSYRLPDEGASTTRPAPLYHPTGLLFLSIFFLPVSVPFWFLNWRRTGQNSRAWIALGAGIFGASLPILLAIWGQSLSLDSSSSRLIYRGYSVLFGLAMQNLQQPFYERHIGNGATKAPAWHLWLAALLALGFFIFLGVGRGK